ncbi:nucleoside triphosphate pyrophosphohydrolase [Candidatus Fermentibacterales bacterium]|nr:nucleoside triphosphate pyrophosphohydrolase [Candidatus Fermentibacterales bacterium]
MADDAMAAFRELLQTVRRLRGPDGCPWDREQTPATLRPFLLEEAFEVADAAERQDWMHLRDELGDLLLHVLMLSVIAEESGEFTAADVMQGINGKLVRRHPHVFRPGVGEHMSPGQVEQQWETIKSREREGKGFFGAIPAILPALQCAWRIQQRAADVGFDWPDFTGAWDKLLEEMEEFREAMDGGDPEGTRRELGDILFSIVNVSRLVGIEPELELRTANRRFVERFERMRTILADDGVELGKATLDLMERAWQSAK